MKKSLWKLQPLSKPTEAHAADAIEIVNGEAVRRVTLPQLDYAVYIGHIAAKAVDARELAVQLNLAVDVTVSALHRLAAAGLIDPQNNASIQ